MPLAACVVIVGAVAALYIPFAPARLPLLIGLFACLAAIRMPRFSVDRTNRRWLFLLLLLMCSFTVTGLRFSLFKARSVSAVTLTTVSFCIDGLIDRNDERLSFFASEVNSMWARRYRLNWYAPYPQVLPGSCWQAMLKLKPPAGTLNYTGFDYERWLFSQRVQGIGVVRASPDSVQLKTHAARGWLTRLRIRHYYHYLSVLEAHDSRVLIGALVLGVRDGLSANDWAILKRTGTSHLLAISGLHVGLAASAGFLLGRFVPWRVRRSSNLKLRGAMAGVLCAVAYTALSGFGIPAVRAASMLLLWYGVTRARCHVGATAVVLSVMAAMLLLNPYAAASYGFWLSFVAVLIFILGLRRVRYRSYIRRCWELVRIQCLLVVVLLPFSLPVAGGISAWALPVNLLLIPLFTFVIMPILFVSFLANYLFPQFSTALLQLLARLLDLIWLGLSQLAEIDHTFHELLLSHPVQSLLLLICAIYWLLPTSWPGRRLAMLLYLPALNPGWLSAGQDQYRVYVMDVGQALSIVMFVGDKILVYDTGNAWEGGDHGRRVVLPVLHAAGVNHIDSLVISHADRDHAGGASSLLNAFDVHQVWVGEPTNALLTASWCLRDVGWQWGDVRFRFLHPEYPGQFSGNDQSCVLLVEAPCGTTLLTGDLGGVLERRLSRSLPSAHLVIGAHHGSMSSSDPQFIDAVDADFVVFSSGMANQWAMPREEVVHRWQQAGTQVEGTARSGLLEFRCSRAQGLYLHGTARQRRAAIWRYRARSW